MAPTEQQRKASKAQELAGGKKVPNARVQRYLKATAPKLREDTKSTLLLKGIKASSAMSAVLQELRALNAPAAKLLTKNNQIIAFENDGQQSLEFLTTKNDCALFAMASHNKKRPNNLVMGRTFDRQVLDMAELGVLSFKSCRDYGGAVPKKRLGSKPLLLFVGDAWQQQADYRQLQNLLTDFYRGDVVQKLVVSGLDHIIVFTAATTTTTAAATGSGTVHNNRTLVHQRTYFVKLKKNPHSTAASSMTPVPYLEPCGPDFDFSVRRTQWASSDLYKEARRIPQAAKRAAKKKKNKSTNMFGETIGRLHVEKQDLGQPGVGRKVKALRRAEQAAARSEQTALDEELGREQQDNRLEFQQTFGFAETELETVAAGAQTKTSRRGGKK